MALNNLSLTFANRKPTEDEQWFLENITLIVQAANELGICLFGGAVRDLQIGLLPNDLDFITPEKFPANIAAEIWAKRRTMNRRFLSYRQRNNEGKCFEIGKALTKFEQLLDHHFDVRLIKGSKKSFESEYPLGLGELYRVEITRRMKNSDQSNFKKFSIRADFVSHELLEEKLDVNVNGMYYDCEGQLKCRTGLNLAQILADCQARQFRIVQAGGAYEVEERKKSGCFSELYSRFV